MSETSRDQYIDKLEAIETRLRSENARLLDGLNAAVEVIRQWHGQEAWDLYYNHSPDMKPIREATNVP